MNDDLKAIVKALSVKFAVKAARTFDRATMVVVCVCWGAAIMMIVFALIAVTLSASTRRAAEAAAAAEPVLPTVVRHPIDEHDEQPLIDRLQHTFPEINFSLGRDHSLTVSATEGSKFREWLTVLSYIDVASPKYRWAIKEFCVGKCAGVLMHAELLGEKVMFEAPKADDKN